MKRVYTDGLHLWQFENLTKEPGIKHFVSDRNSCPDGREFTLSFSTAKDKEQVHDSRNRVAAAVGISNAHLYFPIQVHGSRIVMVSSKTTKEELANSDALITSEKGICLGVLSADCVTILLYDRDNNAIGAVHSGWRGTVQKILEKTLHEMHVAFGTKGENLIAAIGPSVCLDSYEVGEEVMTAVQEAFGKENGLMTLLPGTKAKLDLWKANELQLLQFGVKSTNIELSGLCTVKNNDYFFSARKGDAGRFAAGILMV